MSNVGLERFDFAKVNAAALPKEQGTATTSTAATPRRWLPPASGYARLLTCSAT